MATQFTDVVRFNVLSVSGADLAVGGTTAMAAQSLTNTAFSLSNYSVLNAGYVWDCTADASGQACAAAIALIFKVLNDRFNIPVNYDGTNSL